ncbi:serine/threonine protein kinase [Dictyobacter aurantiacus]|nr:serine/threonine-protein kinase [Dictyobacter aurantiacus]
MQELVHKTIGNYYIERGLAKGGMSEVYLARDQRNQDIVAMKMVRRSAGEYYERFRREARAMVQLHHPHILPVLDHGEYEQWAYMVSPYIEYGTLSRRVAEGPLPLAEASNILFQVASALQFAHEHGMLHRDIKASNVLLRDGNYAYLTDFGLVKSIEDNYSLTRSGFLIGTPEYMAPELVEASATPASDIYALGVLLYQMVTGSVPFRGTNPVNIVMKHLREQPSPPSQLNQAITPDVERVILQTLEKDPMRRFRTPKALANAFRQAYQVNAAPEPVANVQHSSLQNLPTIQVMPASTAPAQKSNALKGSRLIWIAGAALVAIVILILLLTHASSHNAGPKQPGHNTRPTATASSSMHQTATAVSQAQSIQTPATHKAQNGPRGSHGNKK